MKTIVTLTPLDVQADGRTFKQAASVRRLGHRSIVVEGYTSLLTRSRVPFELVSSGPVRAAAAAAPTPLHRVGRRVISIVADALGTTIPDYRRSKTLRRYVSNYLEVHVLRTLRHSPPASLYYLHAFYQYPAVWALCRLHGARYIYDAHDFYSSFASHGVKNEPVAERWIRDFELRIEASCVKNAAEVVTVSEGVADLIEKQFGRRPVVLMNAQDTRLMHPPPRPLREVIGAPDDAFVLVVVGNAKEGMAVEQLLDALKLCPPQFHLAFVGAGYERFRPLVAARALEGRAHLLGPVKPFEIVPFISGADAAAVPYLARHANLERCLPNGFFSAVSAGLPLIYPRLPDLMRTDPEGKLGIRVDLESPVAIKDAMMTLSADRTLFRAGVREAASRLDWAVEEKKLGLLLEKALA